jgi:dihydrofolate reductase
VTHEENHRRRPGVHRWCQASPGGPTEDPTKGFKFGGWAMPYFDGAFAEEIDHVFKTFDLLLGRKTYEIFAAYWPNYDEDASHGGIAKMFDDIKKYVVSRSGEVDAGWAGSVLLRDFADVKRLKQEDGPNLVTHGSTELVHALLANDPGRRTESAIRRTLPVPRES